MPEDKKAAKASPAEPSADDVGDGEGQAPPEAPAGASSEQPPAEDDGGAGQAITKERLIAEAHDFLGYDPHVVAGALADERKNSFTPAEAKQKVEAWLARPAATSPTAEEV